MADKRIIQLPDAPAINIATDELAVDNGADGTRRIPVGRSNGIATLDGDAKLAQPRRVLGADDQGTWDTYTTTALYSDAPTIAVVSITAVDYARKVLVHGTVMLKNSNTSGYWRGRIRWSTDGGNNWSEAHKGPLEQAGGRSYTTYPLIPTLIDIPANTALLIGLQIGNGTTAGDTVTVYSAPDYSGAVALVVDY